MSREMLTISPVYRGEKQRLEDLVPTLGLSKAIEESNKKLHTEINVQFLTNEDIIRKNLQGGGLILANHEGVEDPRVLLASVPQRKNEDGTPRNDFYGVSDVENLRLYGPEMRKQMISTVTDNQESHKVTRWLERFSNPKEKMSDADIMRENTKTVMSILKVIRNGGLVMMFPQGVQGEGSQWRGGIGSILQMLQKAPNLNDLSYTTAYIQGTGFFDFRIYVPGVNRIAPLKTSVTFLESMPLQEAFSIATTPAHENEYKENDKINDQYTIELQKRYEEQVNKMLGY